jgi:hypothetical protein
MMPERPALEESRARGYALEGELAKALAGSLTPGSGSKRIKGDVKSKVFRAEAKYRWNYSEPDGYYLDLDLDWVDTIWNHANRARPKQTPVLAMEWGNGKRLILLPVDAAAELGHDPGEQILLTKTGRSVRLWAKDNLAPRSFMFPNLEVPQRVWLSLSWTDLIELRRECQPVEPKPKRRPMSRSTLTKKR